MDKAHCRQYRRRFHAASQLLLLLFSFDSSLALSLQHNRSSRRGWLQSVTAAAISSGIGVLPSSASDETGEEGIKLYTTPSGLKYIELKEGDANTETPRYGQLCSIKYTGYIKLPNKDKPDKFDSNVFLVKHGNGRTVAGLDEGLHTMRVGGIRRLIIPPKLGYVQSGLGPIPESPFARNKLGNLLDDMVAVRGGNVIFDVELRSVISDEADQGYYEDSSLTPEEFNTLRNNLQRKAAEALSAGKVQGLEPPEPL